MQFLSEREADLEEMTFKPGRTVREVDLIEALVNEMQPQTHEEVPPTADLNQTNPIRALRAEVISQSVTEQGQLVNKTIESKSSKY